MSARDEIYYLVKEIEEQTARARAAAAARRREVTTAEIKPRLGTVSIDGAGGLVAIELDERNARVSTE